MSTPLHLPGDLVVFDDDQDPNMFHKAIVISVRKSNNDTRMLDVYPYNYYVFVDDDRIVGPLHSDELWKLSALEAWTTAHGV